MQLDAGLGALSAAIDILVHQKGDVIYVLPKLPVMWKALKFKEIITEGAFSIGAVVEKGKKMEVTVYSKMGSPLKLAQGLGDQLTANGEIREGAVFEKDTEAGENFFLRPL